VGQAGGWHAWPQCTARQHLNHLNWRRCGSNCRQQQSGPSWWLACHAQLGSQYGS
jgi:hypothetical protein